MEKIEKSLMYKFNFNIQTGEYDVEKIDITKNKKKWKSIGNVRLSWNLYNKWFDKDYLIAMHNLSGARMNESMKWILSQLPIFETEWKFIMDLNVIK